MRFKGIHFIGQPWFVEAALSVIKPFLTAKTRSRIKLHGTNLSTLHEMVARDILPPELGGEGEQFNPLTWFHLLLESSQINAPSPHYCITQTIPYSKTPTILSSVDSITNNNDDEEDELVSKTKQQHHNNHFKCNNMVITDATNNTSLLNFSE